MKKLTALILTLASIACIFCGCGGSTAETGGSTSETGGSTSETGGSTSETEGSTSETEGSTSDKHVISDDVITKAFLAYRYDIGGFSMPLSQLLPKCCPDYTGSFATYEGTKTEHLNAETIASLESGEYKDYLSNSYIVTIGGPIMENPEIPYLVTEQETILKLLILFDENDNVVGYSQIEACSQLQTCATLLMF